MTVHPRRVLRTLAIAMVTMAALTFGAVIPTAAQASSAPQFSFLTNIRVGRHATYDRVVLDFTGPAPTAFTAAWVPVLIQDGSGRPVSLPGKRFVSVVVHNAKGHDLAGNPTYRGPNTFRTPALRNVRAVTITGDFEGVLSIGIGAAHTSWLHVFTLTGPSRLVVDIGR